MLQIVLTSLKNHKQDWEDLAELDPLWAILTAPDGKFNNWNVDKFFQSGQQVADDIIRNAKQLKTPSEFNSVLDFGCGVGRVTRYLSMYFRECYGTDISQTMIENAKKLNESYPNCKFIVNSEKLDMFSDNKFDMIHTTIVLQHMPTKKVIKSYISEFIRILKKNGLLTFQLPSHVPFKHRFSALRNAYVVLRKFGVNKNFLYYKLRMVPPMRMTYVPEREIIEFINGIGGKILQIRQDSAAGSLVQSKMYFVTK